MVRADQSQTIDMGMRAENIAHASDDQPSGEGSSALNLTIELVEPTGSDTFIATRDGDVHFTARVENNLRARTGDQIALEFDMSKAHFFDTDSGVRVE